MKRKYLILFSLSGLILSLDQFSKYLVQRSLHLSDEHPVIPGLMSLRFTENVGFAFNFLEKAPKSLQEIFFIGIPVFAMILIVMIFIKLQDEQMLTSIALTTILAGALGNLVDRLQYGHVIDFLDIHVGGIFHFPAFNIADCSIIIGVLLMFWNTLAQEGAK